jgi:hypothetical protein
MTRTASRSRSSGFSPFRLGLIAAGIGIVVLIGGFALTMVEMNSFRQPLEVAAPPESQRLGSDSLGAGSHRIYFQTNQTPEEVRDYYDREMRTFYGPGDNTRCVRWPFDGNVSNYAPGNGVVPYEYRCMFSRSATGLAGSAEQFTLVVIQPGVRNDAQGVDLTGTTRVEHEQSWQP